MVIVFGSIAADLVCRCARLPRPGQTIPGTSFAEFPGGKGANQALAAARAGAPVALYGAVGHDTYAELALSLLRAGGVDLAGVRTVAGSTGIASITVTDDGENAIVVVAGANAHARAEQVPDARLRAADAWLVLQHECPPAANTALLARARACGARTLLNAAPARELRADELAGVDVLVVNESEAEALAARHGLPGAPEDFARALHARTGRTVVVTLGAAGALAMEGGVLSRQPASPVNVVDTTGAGDAFIGALAAELARGRSSTQALPYAVAAGSLACTRAGAQTSLPDATAIAAHVARNG